MMDTIPVTKSFDFDSVLGIPTRITRHVIDEKVLYIAPDLPTYVVMSANAAIALDILAKGTTLRDCLLELNHKFGFSETDSLMLLSEVLTEVDFKDFYRIPKKPQVDSHTMPKLQLQLTNACNLRCVHCYINAGPRLDSELSSAQWKQIVDEYSLIVGRGEVCLSGGEALIYDAFFDVASYAYNLGHKVTLFSNGSLIASLETVHKLESCIHHIQISLDGATESIHDHIRGKGSFRKVLTALNLLHGSSLTINLAITVMPFNAEDISNNLFDLLISLDIDGLGVIIGNSIGEGRAIQSGDYNCSVADVEPIVLGILSNLYQTKWRPKNSFVPGARLTNCGYGETIVISADGYISPCSLDHRVGRYGQMTLKEAFRLFQDTVRETRPDTIPMCSECDLKYYCAGGCKVKHLRRNNRFYLPECSLEQKNHYYKQLVRENWSTYNVIPKKGEYRYEKTKS